MCQLECDGPIVLQNVSVVPEGVSRNLELKVCVIAHVRNGKMDVAREYWDSANMARPRAMLTRPPLNRPT